MTSSAGYHEEDVVGKAVDLRLLGRLWNFVRPHAGWLGLSTVALALVSWMDLYPALLIREAVDGPVADRIAGRIDAAGFHGSMASLAAVFGFVLGAAFVLRALQTILLNVAGQRTMLDLRTAIFRRVQTLPLSFYDRNPVGRLVTRVVYDVESLNEVLTSGVDAIFHDLLKLAMIMALLVSVNARLALITFTVLPPLLAVVHVFRTSNRSAFREVRARVAALNAYLQEAVQGIRVVQLFTQERRAARGFDAVNAALRDTHLRTVFNYAYFFPAIEILGSVSKALLLWFGGRQILARELSPGEFIAFFILLDSFFEPVREVSEKYNLLQAAMASSERIFKVLDTADDLPPPARPVALPEPPRGEVEFDSVRFEYLPGEPVLKGVSFRVKPGERVAIVGATGAGKTTVTALLTRLYDVSGGSVRVDGVDVREADPSALRRRVAVVLQDVFLFAGTIEGNVTLGDRTISREAVEAACRAVHADGFVRALPKGYGAEVRERGATLSVGQKQLLAFARALARDPAILVLDEATSSVDSATEALIQDAVERLMRGRTAIVVAHRLSTIRSCDRILVMHHGEIREEGSHRELLARGGLYARLYQIQFAAQEGTPRTAAPAGATAG